MNEIYECCFVQMAMADEMPVLSESELRLQFDEFRIVLNELLYGTDGYPTIDTVLNDIHFILHEWQNGKKK